MMQASRRHQSNLLNTQDAPPASHPQQVLGLTKQHSTIQNTQRMIPKNKHGQLDEWSALIELQHQSADKRERQKKVEEKNRK